MSPITPFIDRHGVCIVDGGLATELEYMGYNLSHPLWSAHVLLTHPQAIKEVHLAYLKSGADCIISASYQLSYPGCAKLGISKKDTTVLLQETIALAADARSIFGDRCTSEGEGRLMPIIAASVGPYGAYLANGAEYTGRYDISDVGLYDFHAERWEVLANENPDLIACETIPSIQEAEALLHLMEQTKEIPAYVSFSCKDGLHISDGTPIGECAGLIKDHPQVIAIGVNCTAPRYIDSLVAELSMGAPGKEIIIYPNLGASYDPDSHSWSADGNSQSFDDLAMTWTESGVRIIGGCCQIRPVHIKSLCDKLRRIDS